MILRGRLLHKIKKAGLVGRGGAAFPTAAKWEFVAQAKGKQKYVICNASEGELGVFKDFFILQHYPEKVFKGLCLAMDYLKTKKAYLNLNQHYYDQLKNKINAFLRDAKKKGYDIQIYKEHPSYIGGEETALLNGIEGKRVEPRLKPPYPAQKGLFSCPTLVHNVETLFDIAETAEGEYDGKRFYCISGPINAPGVFHLPSHWSIYQVLKATNNIPHFGYFVQIGGSASGRVFASYQLRQEKVTGAGSIEVYRSTVTPHEMLYKWFMFYAEQSCGKCTPCREGTFQLFKLIQENPKEIPWKKIRKILEVLEKTSFCALGASVPVAVKSYCENILHQPLV